ncbi:MAG: hypothetical protein KDI76_09920 [Xanthomonadales bacterium]|nr:hypothetical protein [Xanthomonadales bacterium]
MQAKIKTIILIYLVTSCNIGLSTPSKFVKPSPEMSIIDFYLFRIYEKLKCENSFEKHSLYHSWCLSEVKLVQNEKIEFHFSVGEDRFLRNKLWWASPSKKQKILCNELMKLSYFYRPPVNLYFSNRKSQKHFEIEKQLTQSIVFYVHYKDKEFFIYKRKGETNCQVLN